jgi:hypothetical protein
MRVGRFTLGIVLAFALPFMASFACAADVPANLYGAWTLKAGTRNLVVLTLKAGNTPELPVAGDLIKPESMSMSGNLVFDIEGGNADSRIVESHLESGRLRFTAIAVGHPDEKAVYTFAVTGKDSATLARDGTGTTFYFGRADTGAVVAADWKKGEHYAIDDSAAPEIARMYDADQADRQAHPIDWKIVTPRDIARREATRKLLSDGALHSGEDFDQAAFIFQHGETSDDFLLAHTLAMVAVSKGDSDAIWIAAATLDRYLKTIGQPQIYGTQFDLMAWKAECKANPRCRTKPSHYEQDPYNRDLISDALRSELQVPSEAKQLDQAKQFGTPQ